MYSFSGTEIARSRGDQIVLPTAFLASAGMFAIEIWAGFVFGSSALHASALDFLADTAVYATSLSGMNLSARSRARAALSASGTTLALGIAVLASTAYHLAAAVTPHGPVMAVVGLLALLVNGTVATMLLGSRGRADIRPASACRNAERIGALAAVMAAAGVCVTGSRWPDLTISWIVGGLAVSAAWQGICRARSELRGALVTGAGLALQFASAQAHGIAGNRLFPATLTFDDPAVADEFVGPVISRDKHPGPVEGKVLDTTVGASLTRLLLPELAIMADSNWTEHDRKALRSETGFGPTHLSLKKGLLYENDPHETLVSASLAWGIAGLGNPAVHDTPYNVVAPGIFFGRGLGDLPDSLASLRPFGFTGALSVDFPTSRTSRVPPSVAPLGNPTILHTGIALEFSTLYLTDRFTGKPPTEEPLNQWVPMVEFEFDTPLDGGYGKKTAATMNPGIAYVFQTYQLSIEAIVPLNRRGGSSMGVRAGAVFFLDDLIPSLFGKPIFR
jgi:hypothetical protein